MPEDLLILLARIPGIADVDARLHLCDVRELPFEDDTFEAVISVHMLKHLPNLLVRLREMVRVLRPGIAARSRYPSRRSRRSDAFEVAPYPP